MLDKKNFLDLLENNENGFNDFINQLNDYLSLIEPKITFKEWYSNLEKFMKEINENKKIDFHKLDLYQQVTKIELLEYVNNLKKEKSELFIDLVVSHTETDYIEIICKRKKIYDDILKDFNIKFNKVNENIKKDIYNDLEQEFNSKIDKALKSNYDYGMLILNGIKNNFLSTSLIIYKFNETQINYEYNKIYRLLTEKDMNNFVIKKVSDTQKNELIKYNEFIKNVIILQTEQTNKLQENINKITSEFNNNLKKEILQLNIKNGIKINGKDFIETTFNDIYTVILNKYNNDLTKYITDTIQYSIEVKKNNDFEMEYTMKKQMFSITHNDIYTQTMDFLIKQLNSIGKKYFIIKKRQFFGYHSTNVYTQNIALINKDYCKFTYLGKEMRYRYINNMIKKELLRQSCKKMINDNRILKKEHILVFEGKIFYCFSDIFNARVFVRSNDVHSFNDNKIFTIYSSFNCYNELLKIEQENYNTFNKYYKKEKQPIKQKQEINNKINYYKPIKQFMLIELDNPKLFNKETLSYKLKPNTDLYNHLIKLQNKFKNINNLINISTLQINQLDSNKIKYIEKLKINVKNEKLYQIINNDIVLFIEKINCKIVLCTLSPPFYAKDYLNVIHDNL